MIRLTKVRELNVAPSPDAGGIEYLSAASGLIGAGSLLYVVADDSPALADHVDLRDYLVSHPAAAQRYARRKYELAPLLTTDRDEYVRQKGGLVEELLHLARSGGSGDVES